MKGRRLGGALRFLLTTVSVLAVSSTVQGQFGNALPPLNDIPQVLRPNFSNTATAPSATSGSASEDLPEEPFLSGEKLKELPCVPDDFLRQVGECQADNTMSVFYNNRRPCEALFDIKYHTESCECKPDDLQWRFDKATDSLGATVCMKQYMCKNKEIGKHKVEMVNCENTLPPCTEENLETLYRQCDYIKDRKTGQKISEKQAVEVIYYFSGDCNPDAYLAIRPPASAFIPCDTSCGAGSYLKGTTCKQCDPGSYSLGGVVRYDRFETIDPEIFQTYCTYKKPVSISPLTFETVNCTQGWYAEDYALEVGQFDFVNQWFPDECLADPNKDCHNNLEAVISMDVDLVTDGYVKFNFSVNSEKGKDGLLFYIDTFEEAIMGLESYEVTPRMVLFFLTAGRHRLYWVYSKNGRFTQGEDIAVIHSIEIAGLALNAFTCLSCPEGFYSKKGAAECEPCLANTVAATPGTPDCVPCPEDQYSIAMPRTKCLPRPPCNISRDYSKVVSGCNAQSRKQTVTWRSTLPEVCKGGDPLPERTELPCEPCKPGFEEFTDTASNLIRCKECPAGQARSADQDKCTPCPSGSYAPKTWSLKGYDSHTGHYPPGIATRCSGACGTSGWRVMADKMDSGRHHGNGAQVFMELYVLLDSEGSVWFNYSVDMSAGPKKRGFFFYIDDNIIDFVQDDEGGSITPDTVRESGPWDLATGKHKISWEWMRISDDAPDNARDNAIVWDIVVKGSAFGYSDGCETIPPGYQLNKTTFGIEPCPGGTYSTGGSDTCTLCPDNSFSPNGSAECLPCGLGTSSRAGDSDCFIGSVNDINSFCSYFDTSNAPESFENVTEIIEYYFYDFSPLNRQSVLKPFGPIRDENAALGKSAVYFINVCNRDTTNTSCRDVEGKPLNTYACHVPTEDEQAVGHRPAVDLGRRLELHSLAEHGKGLGGRGVTMVFEGDNCPTTSQPRKMNVTLICSPKSGYGLPSHWTVDGKAAAFDLSLKTPSEWVVRTGDALPIEDKETCFHDLVWYSEIACHECSWNDYEEVRVNDCKEDKMYTYRWKENLACLPTEKAPLPSDILCQPCTENDYLRMEGTCADMDGKHNVTYSWSMPKVCSSFLEGAVPLPANEVAGPCVQEFFFVPAKYLSPKYVFVFALLGVLLVISLTVCLVAYIKHRRIKQFYSKLVESEEQAQELADLDDEGEDVHMNGQRRNMNS